MKINYKGTIKRENLIKNFMLIHKKYIRKDLVDH